MNDLYLFNFCSEVFTSYMCTFTYFTHSHIYTCSYKFNLIPPGHFIAGPQLILFTITLRGWGKVSILKKTLILMSAPVKLVIVYYHIPITLLTNDWTIFFNRNKFIYLLQKLILVCLGCLWQVSLIN
jgi:hypothetical protein